MGCPSCGEWCRDPWHTPNPVQEVVTEQQNVVVARIIEAMADYNANPDHPLAGFEEAHVVGPMRIDFRMDGDSYVAVLSPPASERVWSCTRDHVTEPCGDCDGCRSASSPASEEGETP